MKRRYTFPTGYDRSNQTTVQLPRHLISILAGKLDELKYRSAWATDSDWEAAKEEIKFIQESLKGT